MEAADFKRLTPPRQLYDIVTIIETDESDVWRDRTLSYLAGMIPDYWQLPKDEEWR